MLNPNPGLILWTIVTFVLLVLLLRKVAWKPLLQALNDREESIRSALERAEFAKSEAERLLEENRKQIARAEQEGRRILNESRELSEKLRSELVEKAQEQSRKIVVQAKEEIERDKEAAIVRLRGEVADLAIMAAGKILDESIDDARHRRIIDSALKDLPAN
jgi:F-type H+-transporting ATPase subunit b